MCVLVQIETPRAVDALNDILAVDGVDGAFIGPADLSANMGYLGQPDHPEVTQAIDEAIRRIVQSGKAAGILHSNVERARHYLRWAPASWRWAWTRCCWRAPPNGWPASSRTSRRQRPPRDRTSAIVCGSPMKTRTVGARFSCQGRHRLRCVRPGCRPHPRPAPGR